MADDDPDRDAIMKRRQRFLSVALGAIATGAACGEPQVCLSLAIDAGVETDAGDAAVGREDGGGRDAGEEPADGGEPTDGGRDAGPPVIGLDGSFPMPCLSMVPPDSGADES
jgi:hypothetical protein